MNVVSCVVQPGKAGLLSSMNIISLFQVSGKDPCYSLSCTILLLAAVTVLRESDKMPGRYFPKIHITDHHCGTRTDYRVSIL